jgi:hypothetical protein
VVLEISFFFLKKKMKEEKVNGEERWVECKKVFPFNYPTKLSDYLGPPLR